MGAVFTKQRHEDEEHVVIHKAMSKWEQETREELSLLVNKVKSSLDKSPVESPKSVTPLPGQLTKNLVVLDTDIGSDVDDLLALTYLVHRAPERLAAVVTSVGPVNLRKAIVEQVLRQSGLKKPVLPGVSRPLFSVYPPFTTGHEGEAILTPAEISGIVDRQLSSRDIVPEIQPNELSEVDKDSVQALLATLREQAQEGQLMYVITGSASTLGCLVSMYPEEAKAMISEIVMMGAGVRHSSSSQRDKDDFSIAEDLEDGEAYHANPNLNVRHDPAAVKILVKSGIRIRFISSAMTGQLFWNDGGLQWWIYEAFQRTEGQHSVTVQEAPSLPSYIPSDHTLDDTSVLVGRVLDNWLEYRSQKFMTKMLGTCPHDVLAVIEALEPERFCSYSKGHILIGPNGETWWVPDRHNGTVYNAVVLNKDEAFREVVTGCLNI